MAHKEEILSDNYREFVHSQSLYELHRELKSLENTRNFDPLGAERKMMLVRKRMNVLLSRKPIGNIQCPEGSIHCDRNYLLGTSLTFLQK